jgi:signal transduction histidine kinase
MSMPQNGQPQGPSDKVGVGLGGMQERINQIGGKIQVQSDHTGTAFTATIPYVPALQNNETSERVA